MLARSGIDFNLPKTAEVSLFLFTVGKLKRPGVQKGFLGLAVFGLARPHKPLGVLKDIFASLIGSFSSFYSGHFVEGSNIEAREGSQILALKLASKIWDTRRLQLESMLVSIKPTFS